MPQVSVVIDANVDSRGSNRVAPVAGDSIGTTVGEIAPQLHHADGFLVRIMRKLKWFFAENFLGRMIRTLWVLTVLFWLLVASLVTVPILFASVFSIFGGPGVAFLIAIFGYVARPLFYAPSAFQQMVNAYWKSRHLMSLVEEETVVLGSNGSDLKEFLHFVFPFRDILDYVLPKRVWKGKREELESCVLVENKKMIVDPTSHDTSFCKTRRGVRKPAYAVLADYLSTLVHYDIKGGKVIDNQSVDALRYKANIWLSQNTNVQDKDKQRVILAALAVVSCTSPAEEESLRILYGNSTLSRIF